MISYWFYLLSSHSAIVFGTGTPAEPSASITLKKEALSNDFLTLEKIIFI